MTTYNGQMNLYWIAIVQLALCFATKPSAKGDPEEDELCTVLAFAALLVSACVVCWSFASLAILAGRRVFLSAVRIRDAR